MLCGELLVSASERAWEAFLRVCGGVWGCGAFGVLLPASIGIVALLILTLACMWISFMMDSCYTGPGIQLEDFSIREMAAFQKVSSTPPRHGR